jgi:hypothetical protein
MNKSVVKFLLERGKSHKVTETLSVDDKLYYGLTSKNKEDKSSGILSFWKEKGLWKSDFGGTYSDEMNGETFLKIIKLRYKEADVTGPFKTKEQAESSVGN